MSQIASTLKARDVEETLDVWFYRPLGYYTAVASKALRLTPNGLTVLSIFIGVFAGRLFYYRDIALNVWGIVLWVVADILDSADGQLARMTNNKSKIGRILDGFATNLIFLSMYLHLYARAVESGHSAWWFLIVLAGGASHSLQSALSDYYRNAYMKYVVDPAKSELHRSENVVAEYESVSFSAEPVRKMLMYLYKGYTLRQERLTRNFQILREKADAAFGTAVPDWFREEYRSADLPMMKYYAVLTTNTRMAAMSVCVLIDQPLWYFFVEAVAINIVMVGVNRHHESMCARLAARIQSTPAPSRH